MVHALEKEDLGKRKDWGIKKETILTCSRDAKGETTAAAKETSACPMRSESFKPHSQIGGLRRPLTLILATFLSVALRSAWSCSDQLRLLLITCSRGLAPWRIVPLLSQPRTTDARPRKATTSDRKRNTALYTWTQS